MSSALGAFSAPVRAWFETTFGAPTPPQAQGWPAIAAGNHALVLAPTGSGKTLSAFLWGIDRLFRMWFRGQDITANVDGTRIAAVEAKVPSDNYTRSKFIGGIRGRNGKLVIGVDRAGNLWHKRVNITDVLMGGASDVETRLSAVEIGLIGAQGDIAALQAAYDGR